MSGNTCAKIFTDDEVFVCIMPLFSKAEVEMELRELARQVGIPNDIHFDRADEHMGPHSDF